MECLLFSAIFHILVKDSVRGSLQFCLILRSQTRLLVLHIPDEGKLHKVEGNIFKQNV